MTEIHLNQALLQDLRGRVVVVTGGAQGIGRATLNLLHSSGANIIFGDWNAEQGQKVEQELNSEAGKGNTNKAHFLHTDVRQYKDQLALFDLALKTYGHVDGAISCAAVPEPGGWFEPADLNLETVRKEPTPTLNVLDINLGSVISFSRIALAYLSSPDSGKTPSNGTTSEHSDTTAFSKSIVLISSVAGITESPGLFAYSSAKHGVIGLMRALRPWAPVRYNVRTNAICPWATDTQLLAGIKQAWDEEKLPLNQPEDVAKFVVNCLVDKQTNGQAIFVAGGRGFDTETEIEKLQPQWLGALCDEWRRGQTVLGLGGDWVKHKTRLE